ncbi:MAG: DUF721 domain-containing protein [Cycloclasticus sp.]|nr:DUF721 domain-containing protein [Cycloclasticus sp.]
MFKRSSKYNNASNGLQRIQQNLVQQRRLLNIVQSCLSEELATHCLHVTLHKNKVTLFTNSSIWASKLTYMRPVILKTLSDQFSDTVHALKVKVLINQTATHLKKPKKLSNKALNILSNSNSSAPNDKLSTSMSKLITTLKKNKLCD